MPRRSRPLEPGWFPTIACGVTIRTSAGRRRLWPDWPILTLSVPHYQVHRDIPVPYHRPESAGSAPPSAVYSQGVLRTVRLLRIGPTA